jgi:hypothetical protein
MTPHELREYRKKVTTTREWEEIEQLWMDAYFSPLQDFMGSRDADSPWKYLPDTVVQGVASMSSLKKIPSNHNIAVFISRRIRQGDASGHWLSRRKGDKLFFDPYDEYQIKGTNQFCQTFAMMNILDRLPSPHKSPSWFRYYDYTYNAVLFIESMLNNCRPNKNPISTPNLTYLLKCVEECKRHPNICLNAIEIDLSAL